MTEERVGEEVKVRLRGGEGAGSVGNILNVINTVIIALPYLFE